MSTAQAARNDGGVVSEKLPVTALCEARSGEAADAAAGRFFGVSREIDVRGAADGRISHKKRDIIYVFLFSRCSILRFAVTANMVTGNAVCRQRFCSLMVAGAIHFDRVVHSDRSERSIIGRTLYSAHTAQFH